MLRRAHHNFLTGCIGWRNNDRADHPISYLDTLTKTGSENIEATLRRRRILFAGFVARMEDTSLPKCVMFGELMGGAGCVEGLGKEWMGCFPDDLRAFSINADQWTTATQDCTVIESLPAARLALLYHIIAYDRVCIPLKRGIITGPCL